MTNKITLFHGSTQKIAVGDYLDPKYCGMWEDCKIYNHKTGKFDTNALYFIKDHNIAMLYARRRIYAVTDALANVKYFIFDNPNTQVYVYRVQIAANKLVAEMGGPARDLNGEVCCTEPVQVLERQTYDIPRFLEYYRNTEQITTIARVKKYTNGRFYAPLTFGYVGMDGCIQFNTAALRRDLIKCTSLVTGVAPCIWRQR